MNAHRRSPSLVARDLVRGYGTGAAATPVLRGLSLTLWPGELSLMMGASGSGKSTLLAALSGLLRPESGSVEALGTSLWSLRPRALEQFRFDHCGYIFQGFNLFPALTAIEQVALPLCFGGEREPTARRLALDALTEVGLAERLQLRPAQLRWREAARGDRPRAGRQSAAAVRRRADFCPGQRQRRARDRPAAAHRPHPWCDRGCGQP
jgi:putative ABC transport system ATP-binding protein